MTYTIGERVILLTPRGKSPGPKRDTWTFHAPAGTEAIINKLPVDYMEYVKGYGFDYQIRVDSVEQWVPASALAPITPKEDDNLSYWL